MNFDRFGFRSLFVLAKIGHDLRADLADTLEAPVTGRLADALARLNATPRLNDNVLDLAARETRGEG